MSQGKLSKDELHAAKHEATSAYFDEEHADGGSVDAWLKDDETAQRWHRYSLISSSLKKDLSASVSVDISEKVRAAIEQQQAHSVVSISSSSRSPAARKAASKWFQPFAKVAVAAGVAAVAVMTVQTYQQPDSVPAAQKPALMTNPLGGRQPVSYSPSMAASPVASQQQQDVQMRRQAQSYLIDHQQQILLLQTAPERSTTTPEIEQSADKSAQKPSSQPQ